LKTEFFVFAGVVALSTMFGVAQDGNTFVSTSSLFFVFAGLDTLARLTALSISARIATGTTMFRVAVCSSADISTTNTRLFTRWGSGTGNQPSRSQKKQTTPANKYHSRQPQTDQGPTFKSAARVPSFFAGVKAGTSLKKVIIQIDGDVPVSVLISKDRRTLVKNFLDQLQKIEFWYTLQVVAILKAQGSQRVQIFQTLNLTKIPAGIQFDMSEVSAFSGKMNLLQAATADVQHFQSGQRVQKIERCQPVVSRQSKLSKVREFSLQCKS
jgi:hypothetical protein